MHSVILLTVCLPADWIAVLQSKSLPAPFGLCEESQQLRYDTENQTFSVSKCRLECQADALNESCGCKEAYMPGQNRLLL